MDEKGNNVSGEPLAVPRKALEAFADNYVEPNERIRLSPYTCNFETAKAWFHRMAGPLDGVIAKRLDCP